MVLYCEVPYCIVKFNYKNMKAYIIILSRGSYDNYKEKIIKVFININKAIYFINRKINKLIN